MKARWPRPAAKNAYRQLSWSIRPGSVTARARKASLAVPLSRYAATRAPMAATMPTKKAAPLELATARRQVLVSVPLYLTTSGSVPRPRDALSTNAYVT